MKNGEIQSLKVYEKQFLFCCYSSENNYLKDLKHS